MATLTLIEDTVPHQNHNMFYQISSQMQYNSVWTTLTKKKDWLEYKKGKKKICEYKRIVRMPLLSIS